MTTTPRHPTASTPLGIWPCDPAPGEDELPELAEWVTPALLRRIITEYGQPGDTVGLVGIDSATQLAVGQGADFDFAALPDPNRGGPTTPPAPRHSRHRPPSGAQPPTLGIVVAALPDPGSCGPDTYQQWRRWLRPGGALVALTTCPAGAVTFANNAGIVVTAATAAGLVYQQHIVAIHARMANDQLLAAPARGSTRDTGATPMQLRVHSDVLMFTNPQPVAADNTAGDAR